MTNSAKPDQQNAAEPNHHDQKPIQDDSELSQHDAVPSQRDPEPTPAPTPTSPCPSVPVRVGPCSSTPPSAILAANAALSLINLVSHLLKRQVESQGETFTEEGGFSERLYRNRSERRRRKREE